MQKLAYSQRFLQNYLCPLLLQQMIKRTLCTFRKALIPSKINNYRSLHNLSFTSRYGFATKYTTGYAPPKSSLNTFAELITNLENTSSMETAAKHMAQLQADEQLYKEKLLNMHQQIQKLNIQNPQIARILDHNKKLELQINSYIQEGKELQERSVKQLDKIKVYGISKIAKEVIEISDHLTQSIALLEKQNIANTSHVKQLHQIYQQLSQLFQKYQIHQFDPKNEIFDPNLHQSVGHIQTTDPTKINLIAQTKRTGFKLKDRLLRSAFVVIYK